MQLQAYVLLFIFVTVQEVMTYTWESQTSLDSGQDTSTATLWGQTGSSYESGATISPRRGQEEVMGTERAISHLPRMLGVSTGPPSSFGPSLQGHRLLQSSSAPPGLTAAGPVDRETPRLPQEATDNGADVSGGAGVTQGHSAGKGARTYPPVGAETRARLEAAVPRTRAPIGTALAGSGTLAGADMYAAGDGATHTTRTACVYLAAPTRSSTPGHPSSPTGISPRTSGAPVTPRVPGTNLTPRGRLLDGLPAASQTPAWRGQRSTDKLHPDISQPVTPDPSHASSQPQWKGSDSTDVGSEEPALSLRPGRTNRSPLLTQYPSLAPTQSPDSSPIGRHTDGLPHSTPLYALSANTRTYTHSYNKVAQTETQTVQGSVGVSDTHAPTGTARPTEDGGPPITPSENTPQVTRDTGGTASSTGLPLSLSPSPEEVSPGSNGIPRHSYSPHVTAATEGEAYTDTRSSGARRSPPRPTAPGGDAVPHTATPVASDEATRPPTDLPSSAMYEHRYTHRADTPHTLNGTYVSDQPLASYDTPRTSEPAVLPSSATATSAHTAIQRYITTSQKALSWNTDTESERGRETLNEQIRVTVMPWQLSTSGPNPPSTTTPQEQPLSTVHPYQDGDSPFASPSSLDWSSTTTQTPKYFIVPDQLAAIRVESIELLLQIILEESSFPFTAGLEKDAAAWVEPYLLKAPGFSRLLGVWSRGLVVQSVIEFRTQGALAWLGMVGSASLLERTGLALAVREGRGFGGSKIANITLGGLQGGVCDWLLQCPEGYKCVSQPHTANHSCSSVCHYDHCHNHGICTHHSGQLPVCRCLVGEHFWYMGLRCDVRMTRARLVGACLATLVVMVTLIAIVALVAVRRYRAILIQAKVDQTRSSYRRFNHFDELSARFWLRSWAGSADSLDNPAFTRSDELLHLRALDRTCCYHDDTLSLASTCPSNGTRLNTVFPHSSQYGWRGSMISMGECGLDSGKASDLSVCSWPVEPIQWTPFPLLQQLASHRTTTVGATRPRSYSEGLELADLGKSWTA